MQEREEAKAYVFPLLIQLLFIFCSEFISSEQLFSKCALNYLYYRYRY